MLQIKNICKEYRTNGFVQKALDHVSLNLRDNEFVAILGPSGSGKTTLLNIIGGLDRYDSGDLIIDGISTQKYNDRDWDSYRNHTIGFVFQSYNLIPHQTVLANVELALTISGVGKAERRQRAIRALEEVGLGKQLHKKPNQMSGGQMQRVAIARALVNNPDILLADEPTGALDSATSVQVMDLLQEVAKDRLVVMVSHNPELAKRYATRVVHLRDGKICSDSDPFVPDEQPKEAVHKNMGKASMSFLTALSLSFNNLQTKKARTLLTAFAGSIGIIGIALILSLSSGVNDYIQQVERDTLSEYPLQIQSTGFDPTALLSEAPGSSDTPDGQVGILEMVNKLFSTMNSNDLQSLKTYLDSGQSGIEAYSSAVEYSYNCKPQIYRMEKDGVRQVNPDSSFAAMGLGSTVSSSSIMSTMMGTDVFHEMPDDESLYRSQYQVKAGRWPENYDECVLVLTSGGSMSDFMLYTLGLEDSSELDTMVQQFVHEETVTAPDTPASYPYSDILGITFKVVSSPDYYQYDSEYGIWRDKRDDETFLRDLVAKGEDLTIVGIVQPAEGSGAIMQSGIAYPASLVQHLAEKAAASEIVQKQLADKNTNVFTGESFGQESGESGFSLDSLVKVDEDALRDLFSFDSQGLADSLEGAFPMPDMAGMDAGSLDLGSLDPGSVDLTGLLQPDMLQLNLPDFPQMDLSTLMQGVQFRVSEDSIRSLVSGLLTGWQEYVRNHPEADYSGIGEDFLAFLHTDAGQQILRENLTAILQANGITAPSSEQLKELVVQIVTDFLAYCEETHPDIFEPVLLSDTEENAAPDLQTLLQAYLEEYLSTSRAEAILTEWLRSTFPSAQDFQITSEQLEKLASDLAAGYRSYAVAGGLPDPSMLGSYFSDYLGTAQAQKVLAENVASMVDASGLQQQLGTAMETYMKALGSSLTESLGNSLKTGLTTFLQQAMEQVMGQVMLQVGQNIQAAMEQAVHSLGENLSQSFQFDPEDFAKAFSIQMDAADLSELLQSLQTAQGDTYEGNLSDLDYVDFSNPSGISIYPLDFESKEHITDILNDYNDRMRTEGKEEQVITYTDAVGTLMSSVTDIVDIISYVLIAFVAISLVVSSIMIGVITYISVLERKKEIGILRAMGASKRNISQVFNAETFIIGLTSGLIGIALTLLILIPGNQLIHHLANSNDINAFLPWGGALLLVALSVLLTLLGGLIPATKAAKSDPVTALRTE